MPRNRILVLALAPFIALTACKIMIAGTDICNK